MSATAKIHGRDLLMRFEHPYTTPDYELFLRSKKLPEMSLRYQESDDSYEITAPARFGHLVGLQTAAINEPPLPLVSHLFDYQAFVARLALDAKRFAIWMDCGKGKTPILLELARQVRHITGLRVCILAPKGVCRSLIEESVKFYPAGEVAPVMLDTVDELRQFCANGRKTPDAPEATIGMANFHKFIPGAINELRYLGGLIVDESSVLKTGGGKIKWNLIKSAKGIEYKYSLTATPAPNDVMEYASQASFLEKIEGFWQFFQRDQDDQTFKVRPHARKAFYEFMSSWSIYLRSPAAFGFADPFKDIPDPEIIEWKIPATDEQDRAALKYRRSYDAESLIPQAKLGVAQRSKLSQIAKGFMYVKDGKKRTVERLPSLKTEKVVELIKTEIAAGRRGLVWTVFNEETAILMERLAGLSIESLRGEDDDDARISKLERFCSGEVPWMISDPGLLGFGLNFQFLDTMIFDGFDDSSEEFYQALRRAAKRIGSTKKLKAYIPFVPGLEDHMWENTLRKLKRMDEDAALMEVCYRDAMNRMKSNL